jgi:hypothetical protein
MAQKKNILSIDIKVRFSGGKMISLLQIIKWLLSIALALASLHFG